MTPELFSFKRQDDCRFSLEGTTLRVEVEGQGRTAYSIREGRMSRTAVNDALELTVQPGDALLLGPDSIERYICGEEILADYCKSLTAQEWADYLELRLMSRSRTLRDNKLITCLIKG